MFEVKEKVAIITGGASGLGFVFADELLKNGLKGVTIADINETYGTEALKQLQETYGNNRIIFEKVDVSNKQQFEDVFIRTVETFKNVDILINNAGILDYQTWEKEVGIDLMGTINGSILGLETYIKKYKSGDEGVILNVSSLAGLDASPLSPTYTATKHGITALSRSMGQDLYYNKNKVRVICVCPGPTTTPLLEGWIERTMGFKYLDDAKPFSFAVQTQEPTHVSKYTVELIKHAPNGSVWVIEETKEPYKIEFPVLTSLFKN